MIFSITQSYYCASSPTAASVLISSLYSFPCLLLEFYSRLLFFTYPKTTLLKPDKSSFDPNLSCYECPFINSSPPDTNLTYTHWKLGSYPQSYYWSSIKFLYVTYNSLVGQYHSLPELPFPDDLPLSPLWMVEYMSSCSTVKLLFHCIGWSSVVLLGIITPQCLIPPLGHS